jgi:hypothetical protein
MTSEVVREVAGRFVAKVPGSPGVIAIGENAAQAQMRAAVVALRARMFRADGANDRAAARQWRSVVDSTQRLWRLL